MRNRSFVTAACLLVPCCATTRASVVQIGPQKDGASVVSTAQLVRPAGMSAQYNGRPVDLVLSPDGSALYVKDDRSLLVLDTATMRARKRIPLPAGGGSAHGIALSGDGSTLYLTGTGSDLWKATISGNTVEWAPGIPLPGPSGKPDDHSYPCGIALSGGDKTAYVCLSRNNSLAAVSPGTGKLLKQIPVGIAPYDVILSPDDSIAYVSNWGGRRPQPGEKTGPSSGSRALVDEREVCSSGSVSVVDLAKGEEVSQIETGLHPSDLALSADGGTLYVANANSDTVSVIDTAARTVVETIPVRPVPGLPFGSAPNALALSDDGKTLYVADGGNNAVAVVALAKEGRSRIKGFIPTAWYPGALAADGKRLYVANAKGLGARSKPTTARGWAIVRADLGIVSRVEIPSAETLEAYTAQVRADARVPEILRARRRAESGKAPVPVPERTGEPSVFEHVVYIIKENKTYDQVFGDIGRGNSDPSLCVYGREITPNHHALADQFVLLDNYYCNGVVSADGHSWATEGNTTDYMEKSFGGWTRSYPFGDDVLAYSSSGLIWDSVLSHGLSFRNYGEMDTAGNYPGATWTAIYKSHLKSPGKMKFGQVMPNENLRRYSCRRYPGWNMKIPDAVRATAFLREFRQYQRKGGWPSFIVIYLPTDHTSGGAPGFPTPRAQVADNDLALGSIVEAISKSRFWPKTCIFVNEDDPQSGFDHVDGHRSLCLIISPYTKRGALISEFYNQTSVLHTMERIIGIPPMNQMDAMAPLMTECFADKADLSPYACLPNRVSLDEMPKQTAYDYGKDSAALSNSGEDPFAYPDRIDDAQLNRVIWLLAKGDTPYPARYEGAHGLGLRALGLELGEDRED